MNKRERRQLVMARRYERLDQRKQQSKWVKPPYPDRSFDLWDFIETQDHPLARLACELRDSFIRRDYNCIDTWRQENPEQSAQLAAYMRQLEKDFKNESN
jgi:hypothetical protein